jgi:hypothetical protein
MQTIQSQIQKNCQSEQKHPLQRESQIQTNLQSKAPLSTIQSQKSCHSEQEHSVQENYRSHLIQT